MRNSELTTARDKKMVEMFHQLYNVQRIRLDDVLEQLSTQVFFLSSDYIYKRIFYHKENLQYYDSLQKGTANQSRTSANV
jgi:hypothetical protein